jgi:urease accessory protein
MLTARAVLGDCQEARFYGRRVDHLWLSSAEAAKRILRRSTDAGTDVAIDLPRGSYLSEGAVLADDGERIVVVARAPEPALVVTFSSELDRVALVEAAARIGLAFGNQHVPVEIAGDALRIPITTSAELARATIAGLELAGVDTELTRVSLGRRRPPPTGHAR